MRSENRNNLYIAMGLALLTVLRLWIATRFELIGDEAYYWQWSRHLDWCYYSKGPLVAWTIRLGRLLLGDTVLAIRLPSVLVGTATLILLYRLTQRLFSTRVAIWALVMAACTPLFVIGSLLMTIDPLFIFFWLAAANLFWDARESDRLGPWCLTGLFVGLGMLAKYTNVAELISFTLFLAWSKPHRFRLRRPGFWLMWLAALLCLAPVIWWNARHDWITLIHLRERGALDRVWRFSVSEFVEFLGGQLAAYTPLFFIGILISLAHGAIRREAPTAYRFLAVLTLPLLVVYTLLALNDSGEANWTAAAILSGLPLLSATWCGLCKKQYAARIIAWVAMVPAVLLALVILFAPAVPIPGVEPLLYRIRGWESLARQVETFNKREQLSLIIGDHYQSASLLAFYMEGHPQTFIVDRERIQNQYSFWPPYRSRAATGENAVYVSDKPEAPFDLQQQFASVGAPQKVWSQWRGHRVREFYLYPCRDYRNTP